MGYKDFAKGLLIKPDAVIDPDALRGNVDFVILDTAVGDKVNARLTAQIQAAYDAGCLIGVRYRDDPALFLEMTASQDNWPVPDKDPKLLSIRRAFCLGDINSPSGFRFIQFIILNSDERVNSILKTPQLSRSWVSNSLKFEWEAINRLKNSAPVSGPMPRKLPNVPVLLDVANYWVSGSADGLEISYWMGNEVFAGSNRYMAEFWWYGNSKITPTVLNTFAEVWAKIPADSRVVNGVETPVKWPTIGNSGRPKFWSFQDDYFAVPGVVSANIGPISTGLVLFDGDRAALSEYLGREFPGDTGGDTGGSGDGDTGGDGETGTVDLSGVMQELDDLGAELADLKGEVENIQTIVNGFAELADKYKNFWSNLGK